MIEIVSEVLSELGLSSPGKPPRYNIVITKGAYFVLEAFVDEKTFYHVKAGEIQSMRALYEANEHAWSIFPDVMPQPIGRIEKGTWEVIVSQGVLFSPIRAEKLRSSERSSFRHLVEFFACAKSRAEVRPREAHSRFLQGTVLQGVGDTSLFPLVQPCLTDELLGSIDALPHIEQHGDFVLNNLGDRGDRIVVFDWEDFGKTVLPGLDLFTLLLSLTEFDEDKIRGIMNADEAAGSDFDSLIESVCDATELDPRLFRRLIPVYLLEFRYLKRSYTTQIQEKVGALLRQVCDEALRVSDAHAKARASSAP